MPQDDSAEETSPRGGRGARWLLVSDIDDTLTGDDAALRRLLDAFSRAKNLIVALNSSRPSRSVDATLAALPVVFTPAALITAMGTELRIDGEPVDAWTRTFDGWDRRIVDGVMHRLAHRPHAPEMQTPYKASFAVEGAEAQRRAVEALADTGLPTRIIVSGSSNFDVLPPRAGKDYATLFLADRLGVPVDRLIVAGDSGNDAAMFDASPRGIVVANAEPQLRDRVDEARVYFATQPHAGGVYEGLAHYGVLPPTDFS